MITTRHLCLVLVLALSACAEDPALVSGTWTGDLAPMNHPELRSPLQYEVSWRGGSLAIQIHSGPHVSIEAIEPQVIGDTLAFSMREPEQNQLLQCRLGRTQAGSYSGKCVDGEGKWALFSMNAPSD